MIWSLESWPSLEAQVAAVAGSIAYDNHDIDDGVRSGLLGARRAREKCPLFAATGTRVERRHPGHFPADKALRALVRDQIGTMVGDLIGETRRRVEEAGIHGRAPTCAQLEGRWPASPPTSRSEERSLKRFLHDPALQNAPVLVPIREEAQRVVAGPVRATSRRTIRPCSRRAGAADEDEVHQSSNDRGLHRRDDRPFRSREVPRNWSVRWTFLIASKKRVGSVPSRRSSRGGPRKRVCRHWVGPVTPVSRRGRRAPETSKPLAPAPKSRGDGSWVKTR